MDRPGRQGYVPPDLDGASEEAQQVVEPLLEPAGPQLRTHLEGKPVRRNSSLDIPASRQAVADTELEAAVGGLPDPERSWLQQRPMMITWLCSSSLALVLFAPFFLSSAIFLGAQAAAILGICCSCMHVFKTTRTTAPVLFQQVQSTVRIGAAAAVLDGVSAILALLLVSVTDCQDDWDMMYEDCESLSRYLILFGLYLGWHAYVSAWIATRCMAMVRMFNPVSSGLVRV